MSLGRIVCTITADIETLVEGCLITVLVVDDQQGILRSLSSALSLAGYHVLTAQDCGRALDLVYSTHVDAILLDLLIPGEDVIKFISQLKDEKPRLKVIAMSGDDAAIEKANRADAVLKKPLRYEELQLALLEFFKE